MPLRTSAVGIASTHRKSHQEATRGRKTIPSKPQEHHYSSDQNIMTQLNLIIGAIAISLLMLISLLLICANTLLVAYFYTRYPDVRLGEIRPLPQRNHEKYRKPS